MFTYIGEKGVITGVCYRAKLLTGLGLCCNSWCVTDFRCYGLVLGPLASPADGHFAGFHAVLRERNVEGFSPSPIGVVGSISEQGDNGVVEGIGGHSREVPEEGRGVLGQLDFFVPDG